MRNNFSIPVAVIIAGALIAGALLYNNKGNSGYDSNLGAVADSEPIAEEKIVDINIRSVSGNDHILGNVNAPIKIVEFSDLECPFCKSFHPTMKKIMEEYGKSGKVAWVYRHFPIDQLHSKARKEAEATECAAEQGGEIKFWGYIDRLFEVTPSNDRLDLELLPQIAEDVGLNRLSFEQCLESGKYAQRVADDLSDAITAGGTGTPYSVLIAPNGEKFPILGAQSFSEVKTIIESALK